MKNIYIYISFLLLTFCNNSFSALSDHTFLFINPVVSVKSYIADTTKVNYLQDQITAPWNMNVHVKKKNDKKVVNSCQSTLQAYTQVFFRSGNQSSVLTNILTFNVAPLI